MDYTKTFSPLVKMTTMRVLMTTMRVLMTVAVKKGWHLNNAFLHGGLHEKIYMKLPLRVHSDIPHTVCKLSKSVDGLKQASRQLREVLFKRGYKHFENNYSPFCKQDKILAVFLAVYVDDILLTGNDAEEITSLKVFLDTNFKIKDLRYAHLFLRIDILNTEQGLLLT